MADAPVYDAREVSRRLPHRQPMLLVDRVLALEPGRSARGLKNVTISEDFFRGHFPGNPVMPGVLIVEALAQTAGLVVAATRSGAPPALTYLVGIDRAKFRRPVVPGDALVLDVDTLRAKGRWWRFRAVASVGGERAAEAELLLAVEDPAEPLG